MHPVNMFVLCLLGIVAVIWLVMNVIFMYINARDFPACAECSRIQHEDWIKNGSYSSYYESTPPSCVRHSCDDCACERGRALRLGLRGRSLNEIGCENHNKAKDWTAARPPA